MDKHIEQLRHQLLNALEYVQNSHIVHPPLTPDNILFTENIGNLKLIDVGYEQRPSLSHQSTADDIYNYGRVLEAALDAADFDDPTLRRVIRKCTESDPRRRYRNIQEIHLALENHGNKRVAAVILAVLVLMGSNLSGTKKRYKSEKKHEAYHIDFNSIACHVRAGSLCAENVCHRIGRKSCAYS